MLLLLNGVAAYSYIVYEDMHDTKLYKETQSLFCVWGTLLTKLNYVLAILSIALEIADVVTPNWRATSANGTP